MKEQKYLNAEQFFMKSSMYIFFHAIVAYLVLVLGNQVFDGFIASFLNIKILLIVAIVSGFICIISYSEGEHKDDEYLKQNVK